MNPQDRYEISRDVDGVICHRPTKADAFAEAARLAAKNEGTVYVFDIMARLHKVELWRVDENGNGFVLQLRKARAS